MITVKDANGKWVMVEEEEILEKLLDSTLFGMSIEVILEFKKIMQIEGFGVDISMDDVREFHARTNTKD